MAASAAAPSVGDPGFEAAVVSPGGFAYNPGRLGLGVLGRFGRVWQQFGVHLGQPAAPQGAQVAFLQSTGSLSQSIANWSAGTYTINFAAARRGNYGGTEDFQVQVDGNVVGTFAPTSSTYQAESTASFTVSAGAHVVRFVGIDSAGGDNTALLDNVSIH